MLPTVVCGIDRFFDFSLALTHRWHRIRELYEKLLLKSPPRSNFKPNIFKMFKHVVGNLWRILIVIFIKISNKLYNASLRISW